MGNLLANTCWPARFPAKWLAFFGVALFVGTIFGILNHPPKPAVVAPIKPPKGKSVTLDLYGFDVEGNPVDAQDQHQPAVPLRVKSAYEITRPVGTKEILIFTPNMLERYAVKQEEVVWRSNVEHQRWLDLKEKELVHLSPLRIQQRWHKIFDGYRVSTTRVDKARFDYPVIFEKRKTADKVP